MTPGHHRATAQDGHGADREALHDNDAPSAAAQPQAVSFAESVKLVKELPSGLELTARHGRSLSERPSAQV